MENNLEQAEQKVADLDLDRLGGVFTAASLAGLPADIRHFEFRGDYLVVYWGGYEYAIESKRVNTPEKALGLLSHLGGSKSVRAWSLMTPRQIAILVEELADRFGWKIHGW